MIAGLRWPKVALGLVLLAFAAGLGLAATSRGSGSDATTLGPSYGISLDLPPRWFGRIYDIGRANPALASIQAGTFQGSDDPNLLHDDDVATRASDAMHAGDLLILLWETTPEGGGFDYRPLAGPPELRAADLGVALEGFPSDHAVGRRFFSTGGRYFDLMVEFGSSSPGDIELELANSVLRTLRIEPAR